MFHRSYAASCEVRDCQRGSRSDKTPATMPQSLPKYKPATQQSCAVPPQPVNPEYLPLAGCCSRHSCQVCIVQTFLSWVDISTLLWCSNVALFGVFTVGGQRVRKRVLQRDVKSSRGRGGTSWRGAVRRVRIPSHFACVNFTAGLSLNTVRCFSPIMTKCHSALAATLNVEHIWFNKARCYALLVQEHNKKGGSAQ